MQGRQDASRPQVVTASRPAGRKVPWAGYARGIASAGLPLPSQLHQPTRGLDGTQGARRADLDGLAAWASDPAWRCDAKQPVPLEPSTTNARSGVTATGCSRSVLWQLAEREQG